MFLFPSHSNIQGAALSLAVGRTHLTLFRVTMTWLHRRRKIWVELMLINGWATQQHILVLAFCYLAAERVYLLWERLVRASMSNAWLKENCRCRAVCLDKAVWARSLESPPDITTPIWGDPEPEEQTKMWSVHQMDAPQLPAIYNCEGTFSTWSHQKNTVSFTPGNVISSLQGWKRAHMPSSWCKSSWPNYRQLSQVLNKSWKGWGRGRTNSCKSTELVGLQPNSNNSSCALESAV